MRFADPTDESNYETSPSLKIISRKSTKALELANPELDHCLKCTSSDVQKDAYTKTASQLLEWHVISSKIAV